MQTVKVKPVRCKQCDYPLWGLEGRVCPECGASFKPSDFEFKPNAVEFHCPRCNQVYFGTGESGLLFPRSFSCVSCGASVDVDDMTLRPAPGVSENQTSAFQENPWTKHRGMKFFQPWMKTTLGAMIHPRRLIRSTPEKSSVFSAMWYALISQFLFFMTGLGVIFFIGGMVGFLYAGPGGSRMHIVLTLLFFVAAWLTALTALLGVWAIAAHLILRLTGNVEHGFGRTWQAICYSSGANILAGAPLVGVYLSVVSWIWWALSAEQMIREGQGVSRLRAALAALALPMVVVGAGVWGLVVLFSSAFGSGAIPNMRMVQTQQVAQVVSSSLASGSMPAHAAGLVADGSLVARDFILFNSKTNTSDIVVGALTLNQLAHTTKRKADAAAASAADALPTGEAAYRVGDFVFTYQGVDPADPAQAGLWLVIGWPDPDVNPAPGAGEYIYVGMAAGTASRIAASSFQATLKAQNQIRASHTLPPIPHPSAVLHLSKPTHPIRPNTPGHLR